MWYLAVECVF